MQVIESVKTHIVPIIEGLGYEVVEVEFVKKYGKNNLTIFIFKQGGITLDDCVAVNDALELPLEQHDITNGQEYVLNISSPGLDREIKSNDDLRRNVGVEVEVTVRVFINKKSKVIGKLVAYDDNTVTLFANEKEQAIERDNIKTMKPYIKF